MRQGAQLVRMTEAIVSPTRTAETVMTTRAAAVEPGKLGRSTPTTEIMTAHPASRPPAT